MNLFNIEHLLVTLSCFGLAIFIFKHAENKSHYIWAYFNCAVGSWSLFSICVSLSKTDDQAAFYWRLAYSSGMFIGAFFYHFVYSYFNLKRKRMLVFAYIQTIISACLFLFYKPYVTTKFLFNSIHYIMFNFFSNISIMIWWSVVLYAFYQFIIHIKDNKSLKNASFVMFWAWIIGFAGGTSTFLPSYGIMLYPAWQIFVCVYVGIMTYVIFYHRLLPIKIVIKRSIIYSLLVATISLTYFISVVISQRLFSEYFGLSSTLISSIIIAIAFIPIKNRIQLSVDNLFLKAAPIEIAHQNEQLREEVAQTEKFKIIANLASSIAHEIKNPLTALQTFNEYLPQRKNDPEFMEKYRRIVSQEIERINGLTEELLDFAKPCSPQIQQINPNEIITQIIQLVQQQCSSNKINIELKLESNILLFADPNQLKQALLNIILNAIDAMSDGGTLTIKTFGNDQYTITVSDTGPGIDPKDLPHIFEPFYTKKEKGTGLGLAITQGIIEKHGGKLTVESTLNQGTIFRITLLI